MVYYVDGEKEAVEAIYRKQKEHVITYVLFIQVSHHFWPLHSLPHPPPQSQFQGAR